MHRRTGSTLPRSRRLRGTVGIAVVLGILAACGGDDDRAAAARTPTSEATTTPSTSSAATPSPVESPVESPAAQTRTITATEADFRISLDRPDLSAGEYEVVVVNAGGMTHDLVVERDGEQVAASAGIAPGDSATFTVTLEPGTYVFYCGVGNHREMGMEISVEVT
ncbi:cupredoxin domain-containing protein [Blastococcus sp. PRF04-17]|uniref:cupredoxin domain-containing protein n=1 Tax=Blastococcus sp. PRF04-17 TaxID=2933797 RepID=UPI001FF32B87|nr:cupredoxin domain-containing protein [Blastococcus sp. PRF04-17]UOY01719.1 cupredoxin domain-containing protein [Blastococcus sp. PRF04-17]